jgi:CopG family nickel-responsive transcriptional regulator
MLERFGVSIEKKILERFDAYIKKHGYQNRSEALRDLMRDKFVEEEWKEEGGEAVATLTLVYNHSARQLSEKLTDLQHEYGALIISTLHVHLNHHDCLEVLVMRGPTKDIKQAASYLLATKGVKHGKLVKTGKELI